MNLSPLIYFSRLYGANPALVCCGGGNTSMKEGNVMYVKGSGTALKDAVTETFVGMDREKLLKMLDEPYPTDDREREAKFVSDCMAARLPGEESKRPSVEALLHALFPQKFVLHLHPTLVNGLTCSKEGEAWCEKLFGKSVVWVKACKPGYTLAKLMKDVFDSADRPIKTVLLENHGVFFAADTVDDLATHLNGMLNAISSVAEEAPSAEGGTVSPAAEKLRALSGKAEVRFTGSPLAKYFASDIDTAKKVMKPFNPDEIVYCGAGVDFAESADKVSAIRSNVLILKGEGVFTFGDTPKAAENCMALIKDSMAIAWYAAYFGGEQPMSEELVNFISNWEVESYRRKVVK
ncbi:MAG: class II aldolase/adducin family protein [Clostridia bacterium]|nr:class II aldolase/adducin family protein [Clostridia bacterium]